MKILIYAIDFSPRIGGEETFLLLLGGGLARRVAQPEAAGLARTYDVTLATRTPSETSDDSSLPFRVVRRPGLLELWRLLGAADVVQLSGPVILPLLLGLLRRKPIVISHHMYHAACPTGRLLFSPTMTPCPGHFQSRRFDKCLGCCARDSGKPYGALMIIATVLRRWMATHATVNATVTDYVKERLALPRSRTIRYGVPDHLERRSAARAPLPRGTQSPALVCFAYVGRLVEEKGLTMLLEAARGLENKGYAFRLKLIGDGPHRPALERDVRNLGLERRVVFTGFLQDDALEAEMTEVDVVVMPSLWPETAGIAAIEQMMRGRLTVAADIGGLGEMVANGTGLKFRPGRLDELSECLRQVLDDPSCAIPLGQAARSHALRMFRQEQMVESYARTYEQLV